MRLDKLPPWNEDGDLHVVVESPRGSTVKLAWDPELGAIILKRPLVLGTAFPFDFGFVPGTRAEDGDPLDAMVLLDAPTAPGVVVACRPIGVLRLSEAAEGGERERNDRILAVACADAKRKDVASVSDLGAREREEIENFFRATAALEGKKLAILGWGDGRDAKKLVERSTRKAARKRPKAA